MFNLRSDLKIYTSAHYVSLKNLFDSLTLCSRGVNYVFKVHAKIKKDKDYNGNPTDRDVMGFSVDGLNPAAFKEILARAGIRAEDLGNHYSFGIWFKNNPSKTWNDFQVGTSASILLDASKFQTALDKLRPDVLMNRLALAPDSTVAALIGKVSEGRSYRRSRQTKQTRMNQLIRLWTLFGVETAISASGKDLEAILSGIVLHDFGVTDCDQMTQLLQFVQENIHCNHLETELANKIKEFDARLVSFGGKVPSRSRPRSPFFRAIYDNLYKNQAA